MSPAAVPLHVAIDVRHWNDYGYGTYIRNLVGAFAKAKPEGFRFTLIGHPSINAQIGLIAPDFEVLSYDRLDSEKIERIAFPLYLRRLGADLVHLPLPRVTALLPKPYVVTIHDLSNVLFSDRDSLRDNIYSYFFRRGLIRADRIIAVSGSTRRDVCNLLSIPSTKVRRIYNAIDGNFHKNPNDAEATRQVMARFQVEYPYLLYAGSIRPQKNIPRLVEAFAVLRADLGNHRVFRNLRLIIIGDEINKHPDVRRAVIRTRADKVVRFLGFVNFAELRAFYSNAEAFVFPSLYEGFGLPPLEAMACGTPVIASGVSSLPEVLGDAATIVNPENVFDIARGIKDVITEPEHRRLLVRRGYERLKMFSWDRTAEQVLQVYEEAAGRK